MNPNIINFNELSNNDYKLIDEILEKYNKNKKLIGGLSKCYKKDNEFAEVLEKENNNILANQLKKEQTIDENKIMLLIGGTEELLLKSNDFDIENKLKKTNNQELLEKIKSKIGGISKINKNLNKQIIKLGIEYYKRKYLRYKLKYVFD
mgnify:CR=1 FL=1